MKIQEPRWSWWRQLLLRMSTWPWVPALVVLVVLAALLVGADEALARSGGSGGGMRFRGGGGGGGGGGFGGGGFHVYGCVYVPIEVVLVVVVILIVMAIVSNAKKKAADAVRVARLRFAITMPGARPWEELERLVRSVPLGRDDGLARLCREASIYLIRREDRITHAAIAMDTKRLNREEGEARFVELTQSARGYFDREVLRVESQGVTEKQREAPVSADGLHDEDGDFGINEYFLVTIIIGLKASAPELPERIATPGDVDAALKLLSGVAADDVIACEVVWTPAAESDILTSDNLLESFPELGPLV
jgi:uncharacterized membrane protein